MSTDDETQDPAPRRSRGVGTGTFNKALDMIDRSAVRDSERDRETIQALTSTNHKLILVIVASYIVFALVVAGMLATGGKVKVTADGAEVEVGK